MTTLSNSDLRSLANALLLLAERCEKAARSVDTIEVEYFPSFVRSCEEVRRFIFSLPVDPDLEFEMSGDSVIDATVQDAIRAMRRLREEDDSPREPALNDIEPHKVGNKWIVVLKAPGHEKTVNSVRASFEKCWTGDEWTWTTDAAQRFDSSEEAKAYIRQNRMRFVE